MDDRLTTTLNLVQSRLGKPHTNFREVHLDIIQSVCQLPYFRSGRGDSGCDPRT